MNNVTIVVNVVVLGFLVFEREARDVQGFAKNSASIYINNNH